MQRGERLRGRRREVRVGEVTGGEGRLRCHMPSVSPCLLVYGLENVLVKGKLMHLFRLLFHTSY